ncbi:putative Polyadenylate-binding protein [Blattamonas nauphoetae]|uniref:Polyadenylate-binding protein n=1 Tax=Blattamonas nauphoetae TaxID=2049346 RepID=A0ABQ9XAN3_9EUKA|nr:putative Polyadenylate-binding protein [Blattamonas nauphoetae]
MSDKHSKIPPHSNLDYTNLFVKYLPSEILDEDLYNLFLPYGPIISAKVMVSSATGESLGYGFVRFEQIDDAKAAMKGMDHYSIGRKTLLVKPSNPLTQNKEICANTNLYIKPLLQNMTPDDLRDLFAPFGTIIGIKVMMQEGASISKQIGFVRFQTQSEADAAMEAMNGYKLAPKHPPLVVKYAETEEVKRNRLQKTTPQDSSSLVIPPPKPATPIAPVKFTLDAPVFVPRKKPQSDAGTKKKQLVIPSVSEPSIPSSPVLMMNEMHKPLFEQPPFRPPLFPPIAEALPPSPTFDAPFDAGLKSDTPIPTQIAEGQPGEMLTTALGQHVPRITTSFTPINPPPKPTVFTEHITPNYASTFDAPQALARQSIFREDSFISSPESESFTPPYVTMHTEASPILSFSSFLSQISADSSASTMNELSDPTARLNVGNAFPSSSGLSQESDWLTSQSDDERTGIGFPHFTPSFSGPTMRDPQAAVLSPSSEHSHPMMHLSFKSALDVDYRRMSETTGIEGTSERKKKRLRTHSKLPKRNKSELLISSFVSDHRMRTTDAIPSAALSTPSHPLALPAHPAMPIDSDDSDSTDSSSSTLRNDNIDTHLSFFTQHSAVSSDFTPSLQTYPLVEPTLWAEPMPVTDTLDDHRPLLGRQGIPAPLRQASNTTLSILSPSFSLSHSFSATPSADDSLDHSIFSVDSPLRRPTPPPSLIKQRLRERHLKSLRDNTYKKLKEQKELMREHFYEENRIQQRIITSQKAHRKIKMSIEKGDGKPRQRTRVEILEDEQAKAELARIRKEKREMFAIINESQSPYLKNQRDEKKESRRQAAQLRSIHKTMSSLERKRAGKAERDATPSFDTQSAGALDDYSEGRQPQRQSTLFMPTPEPPSLLEKNRTNPLSAVQYMNNPNFTLDKPLGDDEVPTEFVLKQHYKSKVDQVDEVEQNLAAMSHSSSGVIQPDFVVHQPVAVGMGRGGESKKKILEMEKQRQSDALRTVEWRARTVQAKRRDYSDQMRATPTPTSSSLHTQQQSQSTLSPTLTHTPSPKPSPKPSRKNSSFSVSPKPRSASADRRSPPSRPTSSSPERASPFPRYSRPTSVYGHKYKNFDDLPPVLTWIPADETLHPLVQRKLLRKVEEEGPEAVSSWLVRGEDDEEEEEEDWDTLFDSTEPIHPSLQPARSTSPKVTHERKTPPAQMFTSHTHVANPNQAENDALKRQIENDAISVTTEGSDTDETPLSPHSHIAPKRLVRLPGNNFRNSKLESYNPNYELWRSLNDNIDEEARAAEENQWRIETEVHDELAVDAVDPSVAFEQQLRESYSRDVVRKMKPFLKQSSIVMPTLPKSDAPQLFPRLARPKLESTLSSTTNLEKTLPQKSAATTRPTTAIDAAVSIASTLKHSMVIASRQPQFLQTMEDGPRSRPASTENWRRESWTRSKQRARTSERLTRKAEAEQANAEEEKVEEITKESLFFTDDDVPLTFNKSRRYTDDPTMRRMIEQKEKEEREAEWTRQMSIASTNTPSTPNSTKQRPPRLLTPKQSPDGRRLSLVIRSPSHASPNAIHTAATSDTPNGMPDRPKWTHRSSIMSSRLSPHEMKVEMDEIKRKTLNHSSRDASGRVKYSTPRIDNGNPRLNTPSFLVRMTPTRTPRTKTSSEQIDEWSFGDGRSEMTPESFIASPVSGGKDHTVLLPAHPPQLQQANSPLALSIQSPASLRPQPHTLSPTLSAPPQLSPPKRPSTAGPVFVEPTSPQNDQPGHVIIEPLTIPNPLKPTSSSGLKNETTDFLSRTSSPQNAGVVIPLASFGVNDSLESKLGVGQASLLVRPAIKRKQVEYISEQRRRMDAILKQKREAAKNTKTQTRRRSRSANAGTQAEAFNLLESNTKTRDTPRKAEAPNRMMSPAVFGALTPTIQPQTPSFLTPSLSTRQFDSQSVTPRPSDGGTVLGTPISTMLKRRGRDDTLTMNDGKGHRYSEEQLEMASLMAQIKQRSKKVLYDQHERIDHKFRNRTSLENKLYGEMAKEREWKKKLQVVRKIPAEGAGAP